MASEPVFLPAVVKCVEDKESVSRPVNGERARTANFEEVVNRVPTRGLKEMTSESRSNS